MQNQNKQPAQKKIQGSSQLLFLTLISKITVVRSLIEILWSICFESLTAKDI